MSAVAILGLLGGFVLMLLAVSRERSHEVDAFAAADRLRHRNPLRPPTLFVAGMASSLGGVVFGLGGDLLARLSLGALPALVVWLTWLREWGEYRNILDAAIVFQDQVPPSLRPAAAWSPSPTAAVSFRPVLAATALFSALVGTGVVLAVAARMTGRPVPAALLGAALYVFIGVTFAAYVRGGVAAERSLRKVVRRAEEASAEELFDALRSNPRSPRLLMAHAARLERFSLRRQAMLEYSAARLHGGPRELDERIAALAFEEPVATVAYGAIVRGKGEPVARMRLEPLRPGADAVRVEVSDRTTFCTELLAAGREGLVIGVEGFVPPSVLRELAPYAHVSPLMAPDPERREPVCVSWRLEPAVREALRLLAEERDLGLDWVHLRLYTVEELLVEARWRFNLVVVDHAFLAEEYPEWRRAGAVRPVEGMDV